MIQLLIEPSYGANLWAQAYLAGIREEARKRGWELQTLTEEAEAAEEPVLLVGSAVGWLKSRLARLTARSIPCLIAGMPPQGVRCGFAAPDYEAAAAVFAVRTPERRALFAVHPSSAADEVKKEAFHIKEMLSFLLLNLQRKKSTELHLFAQTLFLSGKKCSTRTITMVL